MNSRPWEENQIQTVFTLFEQGYPAAEIAQALGRSEASVRWKLLSLGFSSRRQIPPQEETEEREQTLPAGGGEARAAGRGEEVEQLGEEVAGRSVDPRAGAGDPQYELIARKELELGQWRRAERQKIEEAKRALLEDRILEQFERHLCQLPPTIEVARFSRPPRPAEGPPLIAVLVVGDVHCGQSVDPGETEGMGAYRPAQTLARARHLELEAASILCSRNVEKLLLLFAGDIVHGHLGHALEDNLTLPIAQQVDLAVHIFYPFVAGLASAVAAVEVYGVHGNHGRWPGMRKMPADRRWSNLDGIFYRSLAALFSHAGPPNVVCDDRISSRRTIAAGDFRIQLLHGDEVRGGNFCVTGMNREVTNSTLRNVQAGRPAPDYFVIGDKHFSASLPYGSGAFVVNGSFVGADSYGMNFLPSPPSQTLFFLHPRLGKIETHEIRLDHAQVRFPPPYPLKPSLARIVNDSLPNEQPRE